jgi:hypothetical protein
MSESKLQQGAVKWFKLQYPGKLIMSIPNEGKRAGFNGARMSAQGLLKGAPDTFIPHPNLIHHGLFVEFKFGRNKPSPQQLQVIEQLRSNGYRVEVCYSFDSFCNIVEDYFKHS